MAILDRLLNKFTKKIEESSKVAKADQKQGLLGLVNTCIQNSSSNMMLLDSNSKILYINNSMKRFLKLHENNIKGISSNFNTEQIVNSSFLQIFPSVNFSSNQKKQMLEIKDHLIDITMSAINNGPEASGALLEFKDVTDNSNKTSIINAMDRSQAVIEFTPDGIILNANNNFLGAVGYTIEEIIGKHHRIFAPNELRDSDEYKQFWQKLKSGEFFSSEIKRIKKGGEVIWLTASYNPVFNQNGEVYKVIKFASDITKETELRNDHAGQIDAIRKSQAVIEFNLDGTIITANDAFLATTGYKMEEIKGRHHKIFVKPDYANSEDYKKLWRDLNQGVFMADEIERVAKDGSILWLQASYNPIFDNEGNPYKVVKYATNITERKNVINDLKCMLEQLTKYDLTATLNVSSDSEFFELADSMNSFVAQLSDVMARINDAALSTKNAATEIAKGNTDLSTRTEQQAANLQETASTMEQLSNTISKNSENAKLANNLATDSSQIAASGGALIREVVETMQSITKSSSKISEIISVIDGIAFQTNILALNAAVEAARAGEQGRGFAVVASEVRNLAQRSATAAKDINSLISDSVSKINNGNELVNESGDTMDKIVNSINKVNEIMSEIDTASAEQASGVAEASLAIRNMDGITQQNAALVEEAAAQSENMQNQSRNLSDMISAFQIRH